MILCSSDHNNSALSSKTIILQTQCEHSLAATLALSRLLFP